MIALWHGDCLEKMKDIPSESIDLIVTSPPYDNLRTYNSTLEWNFEIFQEIAKELARCLKVGGVIVWVVGDATIKGSETGSSFRQALYFKDTCGLNLHDTMIFRKQNPMPQIYRKRYTNEFEYMFIFSKGVVLTHNPLMVDCKCVGTKPSTYKNYSKNEQKRTKIASEVKDKKISGNIWSYSVGVNSCDKEALPHPAPFPCKLVEDHIVSWSNEGDTVLDPFMGSGTTGRQAKLLKRNFVGIEKDEKYFEIAEQRIRSCMTIKTGGENE